MKMQGLPRMRGDRPWSTSKYARETSFTPHARGSTISQMPSLPAFSVYPACAGIDHNYGDQKETSGSLPRMRGDRPPVVRRSLQGLRFTPHARGSTAAQIAKDLVARVYPACAGIDRVIRCQNKGKLSLPRMRGDRPARSCEAMPRAVFTPHARGSTWHHPAPADADTVYPACAGIDPTNVNNSFSFRSLPRMRGDRPSFPHTKTQAGKFTPHARGSTGTGI